MSYQLKLAFFLPIFLLALKSCNSHEIAYYEEIRDIRFTPDITLIDVREPFELEETGEYPNAINIPTAKLEWAFNLSPDEFSRTFNRRKPNFNDPIITACRSGRRAERAALLIYSLRYTDVKYYAGSWEEWCILENQKCYE